MKSLKNNILSICALFCGMIILNSCSKEEQYRPGFEKGTTFPKINLKGFTLDNMQVRIGPKSSLAGNVFEDISGVAFEVPFADTQRLNRVVFYSEDGKTPYKGSQIRFETPGRDTTVAIFYDGKTFVQNPVFPMPAPGNMGVRFNFKSTASAYKGRVNIELHEEYAANVRVPARDPLTGQVVLNSRGDTVKIDSTVFRIKPQIALTVPDVKWTEFAVFTEIPPPVEPDFSSYVFYIRVADTSKPLPYPAGLDITPYGRIDFIPDYTALYTIQDIRIETETPNRINYLVNDRMSNFMQ
ncbi:hypothetical protein EOD41_12060 [Mucilaginibacter limnophilus]|uniref:Uncharacterized protein n=1 Tax=Mucilaginibacter limnophilus TaxID=1932778 RepID=A0A3S2ULL4_9SPHI|nr:hypothetical protein [Mucilaginibacter limnophilus]RVU00722.1 hypothetical protein EOD41_12060 [Mucilaginibacter limnophilus]